VARPTTEKTQRLAYRSVKLGDIIQEPLDLVRLYANRLEKKKTIVPKIGQDQSRPVAVERVPDIGKRPVPTGGIERAVVDRPNQVR
jgi:hypothetical protein